MASATVARNGADESNRAGTHGADAPVIAPGTIGGGGGGGSFNPSTGYGHSGHTRWEDDTVVHDSYHFFKGHEIAVTERLRLAEDGKGIRYRVEAKGPKGEPILNEMTLGIE